MRSHWKRWIAGLLTVVMLVTMLPTAAYAALWDNTPDWNKEILQELTAFWGDEKTAQEAMELLRQYGLMDEDGNILTDWSGKITIQEDSRPLTIGEARALSGGDVTVNSHPCDLAELKAALDRLETLGLLAEDVPVTDWQLQVDGQDVAPAELAAALESWQAPAVPEEETPAEPEDQEEPEQPQEPESSEETETPEEPGPETPDLPQDGGAGSPEQSGGLLASVGRFFGVGASVQTPAALVVTVLGRTVDSGEVLETVAFLDQYGLLTDTGCAADWGLTLPGGERKTDLTELLSMLESGDYDPDMVIRVDGTPVTMADFKTMMDIQKEVERIQSTYFPEGGVEWTEEELGNLYDLYQQLQSNGIQLYNTHGADDLVFPSGVDHRVTASIVGDETGEANSPYAFTVRLSEPQGEDVTFSYAAYSGSIDVSGAGTGRIPEGQTETTVTVQVADCLGDMDGDAVFFVAVYDLINAAFPDGTTAALKQVKVKQASGIKYKENVSFNMSVPFENNAVDRSYYIDSYDSSLVSTSGNEGLKTSYPNLNYSGDSSAISYEGLWPGTYEAKLQIDSGTLGYCWNNFSFPGGNNFARIHMPQIKFELWGAYSNQKIAEYQLYNTFPENITPGSPWECNFPALNNESWPYTTVGNVDESGTLTSPLSSFQVRYNTSVGSIELSGKYRYYFVPKLNRCQGTIILRETTDAASVFLSAPEGTFYYGQSIPITAKFSFPMKISGDMSLKINGQTLNPVEQGVVSDVCTFLYPIEKMDQAQLHYQDASLSGIGSNGKDITVTVESNSELEKARIVTPVLIDAVDSTPTAEVTQLTYIPGNGDQPEKTVATATVTLEMPDDTNLRNLILASYFDGTNYNSAKLAASIDGGETLVPLVFDNGTTPAKMTATVEIDAAELVGLEGDARDFVMEFYNITVEDNVVTGGDLLFGRYAAFSVNKPVPLTGDDLTVSTPEGWLDAIYVNDPPEGEKLTLTGEVKGSGYTWSQTRWVSSNETVATIDPATGVIHPLAKGTVEFWLEAVNGGLADYQGEEYQSDHISLTIQEGANPYLRIPESQITLRTGDPLTLRWASNLAQKNIEFGGEGDGQKTTFEIKVYKGDSATGTPVQTHTVTYDPSTPNGTITMGDNSTTLPMWTTDESGALTPNQSFIITGLDDTANGYTVTITAQAAEDVPNAPGDRAFTAQTRVTVIARPVSVSLTRPNTLFKVNEGTLTIPYTLTDFDAVGGGADFKLVVTNNSTGEKVLETAKYTEYGDNTSGQFTIDLSDANITDGFRTIYDVTLQAKNTTAGQDWSRDSFTLYIYDKNALDILVQPVTRGGITTVGVNGNTVTMSNEKWIASLSQADILALNRDIDLQAAISINYGAHAWGEASDRIRWAVDNSETAAVNYPQGAYYENIEGLPYSSYAPATQFLLSGKNSGKTVVEAIHDLAGDALSSSVEVTVETLKDKLYLFQFYPAAEGLTMTYTNGDGQVQSATSDSQGRFAIYEASGIASDVYVQGTVDRELYLGTVYQETLVSQEKDAVSLELYPLNSLTLRKAATLPLYLKTPEGEDYDGKATVRVGVYRNGVYCPEAKYALESGEEATFLGTEDQKVEFSHGKATFYFDVTQFNTNNGADPITAADDIEFAVEIRTPVIREGANTPEKQEEDEKNIPLQYYPVLFSAMGTTNEEDAIRLGERVINLEQAPNKTVTYGDPKDKETIEVLDESPFIARSTLYFSGTESGLSANVRGKKGKVGPSTDYPDQLLSTCVFWWGESGKVDDPNNVRRPYYIDDRGNGLTGQVYDNDRYPFTSIPVSKVTVPMNKTQLDHLGLGDLQGRGIKLQYADHNNAVMKEETMPWSFVNMLNLEKATDSDNLVDMLDNMMQITGSADSDGIQSFVNDFVAVGITLATKSGIDTPILKLQLAPTGDPTVFRGLVYIGLNNIEDDNVSGVAADTGRGYDVDYFPGLEQIKGLYSQGAEYGKTMGDQIGSAAKELGSNIAQGSGKKKSSDGKIFYALNGGFETEVYYDFTDQEWKMVVVSGNFEAGGGYGMEWTWNYQVGPVPVLVQLELGASAVVHFDAAVNRQVMDNDYLTQLSIYAYFQAFGGIGFDYAVIALKLGLFGRIGLDAQLRWLNAIGQSAQFGYNVGLEGEIGVKFQVEVLFVSYEKILWSQPIASYNWESSNWEDIEEYWQEVGKGNSGAAIITPDAARVSRLMTVGDMGVYAAELEPKLIDRDYLSQYERTYDRSGPEGGFNLFRAIGTFFTGGGEDSAISTEVIGNSYPQAAPVLSDDGAWLFYLHDMDDSGDATKVRVKAAARNSGEGYNAKKEEALSDEGYGDSGLRAAGSGENAVAVWSRVTERPATTEAGSSITADVQAGMMNSSEIVVAVRSDDNWNVSYLTGIKGEDDSVTSDGLADLAPVVATNGERILVAWRQVASSQADAITTFDSKDYIMYAVSEDQGETWTKPQPIYNGTSGAVKGLEAAMLDSGEAAVVFTLQTGEHNTRSGAYKQEVAYAIIDETASEEALLADGTSAEYQVKRYVQMTDDDAMDENPQVTAVKLVDDQETEYFVIGWSSTSGTGAEQENDIKLAAVDADGNRITGFVDSLSSLIANTGVRVNADFRFSRNADALDDLSILWKESAVSEEGLAGKDGTTTPANYDYLSGLRFRTDNGNISVTAAQRIAQMGESTIIDNFDAYVGTDGELISVLQGTYYNYTDAEPVLIADTENYTVYLPKEKTSIYLGSGGYTDTLRVDSVIPDYQNIRKGMEIPVQISVTNLGTQPMSKVKVSIGSSEKTFEAGADGSSFVAIAPGETRALTVYYTIPADETIPNPEYTITGTFQSDGSDKAEGTLTLNIPDLGIAESEVLLEAQDGQRVLQFTLYNDSDAELANSGRSVKFNIYSDPECTQPIPAQYFQEIVTYANDEEALKTISGNDLAKIDEGYYTLQYRFDLAKYIEQVEDGETPYADGNGEVRDGGITLYAKAWVEVSDGDESGEMLECIDTNNIVSIQLESLLKQADGEHVTISQQLSKNEGGGTDVTVTLSNNSIVSSETGNVVVWLYDANDNVVDVQQSYTTENGLITLTPEERKMMAFSFDKSGVRAEVAYGDQTLAAEDDATLQRLLFSGLATLPDFVEQEDGSYAASVEVSQVSSTTITAMATAPGAVITVNGKTLELAGMTLDLSRGENVLTVKVTSGGEELTYTLTVQNNWPSSGGGTSSYPVETPKTTDHGTVSVSPKQARNGQTVTITATPDEGYQVGKVTVTRSNGTTVTVTAKGNGVYTFTMPSSKVTVDVTFVPVGTVCDGGENCPCRAFTDLSTTAWYHEAVDYVLQNSMMSGYGNGLFGPNDSLSRAQLCQILYNREGKPAVTANSPFTDVANDAWYADAVIWANSNGIVGGYGNGMFGPNDPITREQLAAILWRYAGSPASGHTLSGFTDADQISSWAMDAMLWANENNILNGDGSGHLIPKGKATRAHVAQMIRNFIKNLEEHI